MPVGQARSRLLERAATLGEHVTASGRPLAVATGVLCTQRYPTRLALGDVPRSPAAWVTLTVRMLVVQCPTPAG